MADKGARASEASGDDASEKKSHSGTHKNKVHYFVQRVDKIDSESCVIPSHRVIWKYKAKDVAITSEDDKKQLGIVEGPFATALDANHWISNRGGRWKRSHK